MDRRNFLKTAGLTTASLFVAPVVKTNGQEGVPPQIGEDEILAKADARIDKHRKGDAVLKLIGPDGSALAPGTQVRIEQTSHQFLFGCNIFMLNRCKSDADNAAYAQRFADLLNYATLPFYWWTYEPKQDRPDYARTEEIFAWCKAHNITAKGHPLAWNYVDPKWLPDDPNGALRLQLDRIEKCVQRFKGRIDVWDVVNEATHYDRDECKKRAPKLTALIDKIGVSAYLQHCFKTARKANPNATLLINDYRTDPDYADKVISKLVDESGKPLYDVIGIQSHQHGSAWPVAKIWEVCERFAKFGRPLHFTETTFLSGRQGWNLGEPEPGFKWESTPEGERRQCEDVVKFYTVLFSHPAVEAVTWWDFSDQGAWQQAPAGLVRADMSPKPAYERLKDLVKNKWWTRTRTEVRPDGSAGFRGFFGQYRISAQLADRELSAAFRFTRPTAQPATVRLS